MKIEDAVEILKHRDDFFFVLSERRMFRTISHEIIKEVKVGEDKGKMCVVLTLRKSDLNPINDKAIAPIESVYIDIEEAIGAFKEMMDDYYF